MIAGYDETGYYYIEHDSLQTLGPKPYNELGESDWGCLDIPIIRPGSISDNLKTIKDIFEYAANVGNSNIHTPNQGYTMGVDAYKVWWESILKGKARYYGVAYNASFWAKCKNMAVLFLQESKLRIGIFEDMFDCAIVHYENCAKSLTRLSQLFSLSNDYDSSINEHQKEEAINLLKAAQKSEINGLTEVNNILNEIYKIW